MGESEALARGKFEHSSIQKAGGWFVKCLVLFVKEIAFRKESKKASFFWWPKIGKGPGRVCHVYCVRPRLLLTPGLGSLRNISYLLKKMRPLFPFEKLRFNIAFLSLDSWGKKYQIWDSFTSIAPTSFGFRRNENRILKSNRWRFCIQLLHCTSSAVQGY